jgi:protein-S-isoprenylcysteine O-methyltransferase Ste14
VKSTLTDEIIFREFLAFILMCTGVIRAYYGISSKMSGGRVSISGNKLITAIVSIVGLFGTYLIFGYLIFPDLVAWSALPLPSWMRWIGVSAGVATIPLFFWVHHTLGKYFSPALEVREKHALVTSGPYGWVRHPMYTVLILLMIAFFLISSNWAIGVVFVGISAVMAAGRVGKEEAMMAKKFGNKYREYRQKTGQLLNFKFLSVIILLCLMVFMFLWLLSPYGFGLLPINFGLV